LITNAIARRYAKALIELATEEAAVDKIQEELKSFESLLANLPESSAVFSSPAFTIEAKRALLKEILGRLPISTTAANFLLLLLDKNRLNQLPFIMACYQVFADDLSGIVRGTVISALPLADSQVNEIREALAKNLGKKVLLQVDYDPSLIGGVVTKIGDRIFDGSIKTQLDRIQDILQKG
jgi:F-type H+-transporting ATPase subunit delta